MTEIFRTKTFKSGNGIAVRFPNAWGIQAGSEMEIFVEADGSLLLRPVVAGQRALSDLFGSFSPGFLANGREDSRQADRDWSADDSSRSAA